MIDIHIAEKPKRALQEMIQARIAGKLSLATGTTSNPITKINNQQQQDFLSTNFSSGTIFPSSSRQSSTTSLLPKYQPTTVTQNPPSHTPQEFSPSSHIMIDNSMINSTSIHTVQPHQLISSNTANGSSSTLNEADINDIDLESLINELTPVLFNSSQTVESIADLPNFDAVQTQDSFNEMFTEDMFSLKENLNGMEIDTNIFLSSVDHVDSEAINDVSERL